MTSSKPLSRTLSKGKRTDWEGSPMDAPSGDTFPPRCLSWWQSACTLDRMKRAGLPTWLMVKVPRKPSHLCPNPCQEGSQLHQAVLCSHARGPRPWPMCHSSIMHTQQAHFQKELMVVWCTRIYTLFIYRCMLFLSRQSFCGGRTQTHSDLRLSFQGLPTDWPSTGPIKYFKSKKGKNNSS